jgi:hypothetical protein
MASLTGFIEGRFYDPAQLVRLKAHAHSPLDAAIYTLRRFVSAGNVVSICSAAA